LTVREYPLGLRRQALLSVAQLRDGGSHVIELVRAGKLPEDLKTEATTLLHTSPDRRLRELANSVLPLPKTAAGRPLPSIFQLIRRDGDAEKGRAVFFRAGTNSCGSCHRVQGNGQWVGPDLSTIGVKYGKDELIRSILSPSAAIGFSFRSLVLALTDGRVVTGLPVEETADRLVLKTADGQRLTVPISAIEERRTSDVSLMPDGLAQTMTDQELVDLLAYLTTLKQPVSIVGQYQAVGPVHEPDGRSGFGPISKLDLRGDVKDGRGHELSWRRVNANAEGQADLSPLIAGDTRNAAYVWIPVVSGVAQKARLVVDTPADIAVWLDGRALEFGGMSADTNERRVAVVDLPEGSSSLVIRVVAGTNAKGPASLVTTFVADRPVSFIVATK
jgi:putative heme-binding domain-containing protein